MLQNIRDNTQGLIAKFIIGLIIIPFALFGIDSLVGNSGPASVATVNGDDITLAELDQAMNIERRRRLSMMGDNVDPAMLDDKLLRGPVLERLIQQRLLLQTADETSVGVSSVALDQAIIGMSQFQEAGQFSSTLYENVLRSNGYTTAYFKQLMADDLVISQLNTGVAGSNFITEKELEGVAKVVGQQRSFRYITIPRTLVSAQVSVEQEQVQQYYEDNIQSFQTEERVRLEYIELKQQDFFKPVSDVELEEAYELEMAAFEADEERRAAHILIEITDDRSESQAQAFASELADRLAQGESFATLAEELSEDAGSARNGGDLGFTTGDSFPPEFEEALSALALNQVSKPVKTDAGFHLIQATEIKAIDKPSFSDRKSVISQRLQMAAAEVDFVNAVESLRDLVFNSEGLSGPAEELDFSLSQSDLFGRSSAEGSLAKPQVLAAAYSADVLEEGNNSEVIELAADHFIVVNVVEHKLPAAKPLAEVEADILARLKQQKATELALTLAEEAIASLESGASVADLAKEKGYEWQVQQAVSRNSAKVDRSLLAEIFAMPEVSGDSVIRKAIAQQNGDVAVVQLEKVEEGSWDQFSSAEQRGLKAELERGLSARSLNGFLQSLRDGAEVRIL